MTDEELRAELHGISGEVRGVAEELRTEMRGIAGELRADIHDELRGMNAQMDGMREELRATKEEIAIRVEKVETNLLTAFHSWASPMENAPAWGQSRRE